MPPSNSLRVRKRSHRVAKQIATIVTWCLILAWLFSYPTNLYYYGSTFIVVVTNGVVGVFIGGGSPDVHGFSGGWKGLDRCFATKWLSAGRFGFRRMGEWYVVSFWLIVSVALVVTALLWWLDRPFPRGMCQRCGYDLRGTPSDQCPECGESSA
jgi:hypothetical protein